MIYSQDYFIVNFTLFRGIQCPTKLSTVSHLISIIAGGVNDSMGQVPWHLPVRLYEMSLGGEGNHCFAPRLNNSSCWEEKTLWKKGGNIVKWVRMQVLELVSIGSQVLHMFNSSFPYQPLRAFIKGDNCRVLLRLNGIMHVYPGPGT